MKIFLVSITLQVFCSLTFAAELDTYWPNRQGLLAMQLKKNELAQKKFSEALAADPLNAEVQLNLGLTFYEAGQMEKAQAAYETAKKSAKDPATLFAANYNLGELMQKAKQTDKALAHYQAALKYNPQSIETKTNIELLTQDKSGQGSGQGEQQQPDKNQGEGSDQNQDQKDGKDPKDKQDKKDQGQKKYGKGRPQPQKFKSENLTQGDVNKILDELKRQEQRVRAEFNKKEMKEVPRDKDW